MSGELRRLRVETGRGLIQPVGARRSLFRVIPAEDYLDFFVSDRSHMVSYVASVIGVALWVTS